MTNHMQAHIDELVELGEDRDHLEAMTPDELAWWALDQLLAHAAQARP